MFWVTTIICALSASPTTFLTQHLEIHISAINKVTSVLRKWKIVSLLLRFFCLIHHLLFGLQKIYSCFNPPLNRNFLYDVLFKFQADFTSALYFILLASYTVQFWMVNIEQPLISLRTWKQKAWEIDTWREKKSFNTDQANWRHSFGYRASEVFDVFL